jgi:hypothetical protein
MKERSKKINTVFIDYAAESLQVVPHGQVVSLFLGIWRVHEVVLQASQHAQTG